MRKIIFDTNGNEKQKEVARLWINHTTTDIVYGGSKGSGKSYLGCSLIFGDALIYPETFYFIARKSLTNIRKFTIPSIHEVLRHWGITPNYYKYNGQDNFFELYNKSRVYLIDASFLPSDPDFYRFGSMQMTRGWIEEAGEFEEAAKNNLAASIGRWKNDEYNLHPKLLQTCNPSKNYLYREYYKPFKAGQLPSWRAFIQALPHDNKRLPSEYLPNLERSLNKNERERLLKGNWEADDDPAALIDYEKALDVFTNTHVPGGRKYVTADIARLGGDRVVIIEWDGMRGKVRAYNKEKLNVTTTNIEAARTRLGIGKSDVIVDSDGMGSGVEDFGGFKGFINNARPMPDPKKPVDANGKPVAENFDNLKSQCGFRMAEIINANGLYLECEEWMKELIIEEFEQVKQKALDSDMKKGLIPKDKIKEAIGRSPDFWDCFVAGTKVLTSSGEKNIEDIKSGDIVVTPHGNRKVIETIKRKSNTIHTINNKISCTGNHRFITNNGLISADALMINDYIYRLSIYDLWAMRLRRLLNIKERNIGFLQQILSITTATEEKTGDVEKLDYINKYSSTTTGQYPKDTTFTILTTTLLTTIHLIWNWLKGINTEVIIKKIEWLIRLGWLSLWRCLKNIQGRPLHGIRQKKGVNYIQRMAKRFGLTENNTISLASFADQNLNPKCPTREFVQIGVGKISPTSKRNISSQEHASNVEKHLKSVRMRKRERVQKNVVVKLDESVDVYTLMVEGDNVYYANGYLVENCVLMRIFFELKPRFVPTAQAL